MLGRDLAEPTRAFQLATQLSDLLFAGTFDTVLAAAGLESATARDIARIGLGNYAAGALMMPYRQFRGVGDANCATTSSNCSIVTPPASSRCRTA